MGWLLLALGVVSSFFVANAFLPVRRNVWLFVPSFVGSWLAIELAWLNIVVGLVLGVPGGLLAASRPGAARDQQSTDREERRARIAEARRQLDAAAGRPFTNDADLRSAFGPLKPALR